MRSNGPKGGTTRRDFLIRALPAGAVCAACPGVMDRDLLAQAIGEDQETHKFLRDAGLTTEQVFQLAYTRTLIPFLRGLGRDGDRAEYLEHLKLIASENAKALFSAYAKQVPENDLATFTASLRDPESRSAQALTIEIVEFTEDVCECRVTECLWAQTFRAADAADLGQACICHPDYAAIEAFNPEYEMVRDKTLMEGDDCCNHRYRWRGLTPDRQ